MHFILGLVGRASARPTNDRYVLRRAVLAVGLLNLAYFGIEFTAAAVIHSVSLFADSIDFLEDASANGLILLGLGWSARGRARLAVLLLMPDLATLWSAWRSGNFRHESRCGA